ncbi:putative protein N(5)-glutamine methyltransferase [Phytohabitans flavus]|uniref:putative protein N(5)-glutamine methyltransferase n=1 Tax=Phytohabitans flavus TaxID=1076124 RepID=UPI0036422A13
MPPDEGDARLRERLVAGDGDALAEVYDRWSGLIHTLALRITDDAAAAEDITQDVFVRLWQRPEAYDPERGALRTWLCMLARSRALDWTRRREARARYHAVAGASAAAAIVSADIGESVIWHTETKVVREAVQALPDLQRQAVQLAYYRGTPTGRSRWSSTSRRVRPSHGCGSRSPTSPTASPPRASSSAEIGGVGGHGRVASPRVSIVEELRAAGCVFAEDEARLLTAGADGPADLAALVGRRVAGEPLEYVLGWAEFCGLRIAVDPGVFVPRQRTALLVHEAVTLLAGRPSPPTVVDLCCGSGAVAAAVAAAVGPVTLHAADVDPAAVRCARRNLAPAGGHAYQGDLDAPLPTALRGRVDVLVANVPYVPTAELAHMPPEARDHEPRVALDGGGDGLDVLRRVAAAAPGWLAPGGHLLIETSDRQATAAMAAFAAAGLTPRLVTDDDLGATAVVGTRIH